MRQKAITIVIRDTYVDHDRRKIIHDTILMEYIGTDTKPIIFFGNDIEIYGEVKK